MRFEASNQTGAFGNRIFSTVEDKEGHFFQVGVGDAGNIHLTAIAHDDQKPSFHAAITTVANMECLDTKHLENCVTVRIHSEGGSALWLNIPADSVDLLVEVLRQGERRWFQAQAEKQMDSLGAASAN